MLCVHGMSGAATNWTDLMAELAPDFDCAAVDLPGSGFSPPPREAPGTRSARSAGTVIRLIEALGAGPVHLVGNSMGGAVVGPGRGPPPRPAADAHPGLAGAARPADPRLERALPGRWRCPFVGDWRDPPLRSALPAENRVAGVLRDLLTTTRPRVHPDRFAHEVEALRRRDGLSYERDHAEPRAAHDRWSRDPAAAAGSRCGGRPSGSRSPSLVLFGSHDRLVNPRLAAPARRAPSATPP